MAARMEPAKKKKKEPLSQPKVKEARSVISQYSQRRVSRVPLDYSFKGLVTMSEVVSEEPTSGRRKQPYEEERRTKDGKLLKPKIVTALRLCNNELESLEGWENALNEILDEPRELTWIDLSFNALATIDPVLLMQSQCTTLYLHGNDISDLHEIDKLAQMPFLKSLTLHGNPIETLPEYRQYVLSVCQDLKHLDFGFVTNGDRSAASTWNSVYKRV